MIGPWKVLWRSPFMYTLLLLWAKLVVLRTFLFEEVAIDRLGTDLAAVLVIVGLIELFGPKFMKPAIYWGINLAASLIFLAATVYYSHFGAVVTYTALKNINQLGQISDSVKSLIEPINFVYFLDFALILLLKLIYRRPQLRILNSHSINKIVICLLLITAGAYSAWSIKAGANIANELKQAEELGFLSYQVSTIWASKQASSMAKISDIEQLKQTIKSFESQFPYQSLAKAAEAPQYFGSQQGKNVVIIQLEAFQNFPIGLRIEGQEVTPVINALMDESFYFPNIYQQIGQGNTSDAEFMSNTSIYPTGTVAMSTGYSDRDLPSLPKLLDKLNYVSSTFHVNTATFWDRDKMYPALGFTNYYDKKFFNNDNFNSFGASDEELYNVGIEVMKNLQQLGKPFYTQFVSVSSHHPFVIPEDRQQIKLPDSLQGNMLKDYLTSINYTDYALGKFIEQLKAEGLWENTMLVLYGDHFGLQLKDNEHEIVSEALGITYHPRLSRFNIPLLIRTPGQTSGQTVEQVGGQMDILPTVANLLGIQLDEEDFLPFGHDLLNIENNILGMRYYLPTGSFFNNDILFVPGKGFEDGTAYSIDTLQPVEDFSMYRSDYDYIMGWMDLSDKYVNLLPARLIPPALAGP
ncbi:LTA synthase family protein [Paenibacillus eucommiae]|uniref:Phosphoglycerol transferase MdoB-like AlkP superfamily enzyme n=1 Tax=Paenibacillus eucommiae TaxID=1355755 RepID=A0ABS4IS92_9BACL|nr:LTA synthase family protein [Paenibacillus eucommiae]MBP1990438.1 phosphoglycerol transferase MdoB-like AlkP superfamily enzyme [Paenibacillus eucommiae]